MPSINTSGLYHPAIPLDDLPPTTTASHSAPRTSQAQRADAPPALSDIERRTQEIAASIGTMFKHHLTEENSEPLQALINDRAKQLAEDGEDAKTLEGVMSKGAKLGHAARIARGAILSSPFCAASLAGDFAPSLKGITASPHANNAILAAMSAGMDGIGGVLLQRATSDLEWLVAEDHELEPAMQAAAQKAKPGLARKAAEGSLSFQTFSGRNAARLVVQPAVTLTHGPKTAAKVDALMAGLGSLVCGAGAYEVQHAIDKRRHRTGPEYLLARTDWHERYKALKSYGVTDAVAGVARRAALLPLDIARDGLEALRSPLTPAGLAAGSILTGGLTGISEATAKVTSLARKAGFSPAAVDAFGKLTVLTTMAPVIGTWVASAIVTQPLVDEVKKGLDRRTGKPENLAHTEGMVPVPEGRIAVEEPEASGPEVSMSQTHLTGPQGVVDNDSDDSDDDQAFVDALASLEERRRSRNPSI